MAKQYIVARGQIEKGKQVLARRGEPYTPKNAAERDRLLAAGVIVEPRTKAKAAEPAPTAGGGAGDSGGETDTGGGPAAGNGLGA
ncbi:hypothetical protein EQG41_20415 [Billgrantia azerbaijanica]|nr:hypothetical protein EQG41_20670 [Halomonas azerbaijanica]TFH84810.1 hypothetical protein EQG41_20415 [Halomonas azerbaijanica]